MAEVLTVEHVFEGSCALFRDTGPVMVNAFKELALVDKAIVMKVESLPDLHGYQFEAVIAPASPIPDVKNPIIQLHHILLSTRTHRDNFDNGGMALSIVRMAPRCLTLEGRSLVNEAIQGMWDRFHGTRGLIAAMPVYGSLPSRLKISESPDLLDTDYALELRRRFKALTG